MSTSYPCPNTAPLLRTLTLEIGLRPATKSRSYHSNFKSYTSKDPNHLIELPDYIEKMFNQIYFNPPHIPCNDNCMNCALTFFMATNCYSIIFATEPSHKSYASLLWFWDSHTMEQNYLITKKK
eukprot:545536_1